MKCDKRINIHQIICISIFVILIFLMCAFESWTDNSIVRMAWQHIDEMLLILLTFYVVLHYRLAFQLKGKLIIIWLFFLLIGLLGNIVFQYQPIIQTLEDMLLAVNRFMIGYIATLIYIQIHKQNVLQYIFPMARFITFILFVLAVHDICMTPFFPQGDVRFMIPSLMLMFQHQTYLAVVCVTLLVVLGVDERRKQKYIYMMMITFVGLLTFRGKAIGFFGVYWIVYIAIIAFEKLNYYVLLAIGGIGAVAIGIDQILQYYVTNNSQPRSIMLKDSIILANKGFPFGTGFGTFGSSIAAQFYSPLYFELGYDKMHGMTPDYSPYLTDGFWFTLIAQNGWIGTILFVGVIIYFVALSIHKIRENKKMGIGMLTIMVYMLICTTAESSFFNPASFLLFMLFAAMEFSDKGKKNNE